MSLPGFGALGPQVMPTTEEKQTIEAKANPVTTAKARRAVALPLRAARPLQTHRPLLCVLWQQARQARRR